MEGVETMLLTDDRRDDMEMDVNEDCYLPLSSIESYMDGSQPNSI